jgi:hypothetical protein
MIPAIPSCARTLTEQQDKSDLGKNAMIALQSAATIEAILSHSITALLSVRPETLRVI